MSRPLAAQQSFQTARRAGLTASPFTAAGASPIPFSPLPKLDAAPDWDALRAAALEEARAWLGLERANTRAYYERSGNAFRTLRHYSDGMDILLQWLLKLGLRQAEALGLLAADGSADGHAGGPPLALVAVGGYGRHELFAHSDLDILFLHGETLGAALEPIVQFVYYLLWDLGFQVGQAVRTVAETLEASEADHTVLTALLDARLISGQRRLLTRLMRQLQEQATETRVRQFTEAKLEERDRRHEKHGNSRYLLEPNVKDGKGGLRDLHTLYWIARYAYGIRSMRELVTRELLTAEEYRRFQRALKFLCVVRLELHYAAGRPEDRLTFDKQRALAEKLGFRDTEANRSVERFMKRYFQVAADVGNLTRLLCASLEEHHRRTPKKRWTLWPVRLRQDALKLEGERLALPPAEEVEQQPLLMLELFRQSLEEGIDIHPHALQLVSRHLHLADRALRESPEANALLLSILLSRKNPEDTLRRMREVGLLGKLLPDFGRVVGQMQFDMFHIYTVDEHILRAVGILHRLEAGEFRTQMPVASSIVSQVQSRRVLYLAALCHDIAKGRGGDHARHGAVIARQLARRFGFSAAEEEAAEWLVLHHQAFSDTAHKRDLTDPDTIRHFVETVQTLERLRLLLILTVVDMQAVGPHIWNGWKAALLRELYRRSEQLIRTGALDDPSPEKALGGVLETLTEPERAIAERYIQESEPAFLGSTPEEEHAIILRLLARVWRDGAALALDVASQEFHDISRLVVVAPDRPGLLADVTGAFAREGASVVGARITTLKSGWALQLWQLQEPGQQAITDPARRKRLERALEAALTGKAGPQPLPKQPPSRKHESFDTPIELFFENGYSDTFTIMEITAPDRVGLLHTLCRTLTEAGINIASAHIGTYGEKAVDVLYLKDRFGMKLAHPGKLKALEEKITAAIRALVG